MKSINAHSATQFLDFDWALPSFTEFRRFYRVLLGFYWVFLVITEFLPCFEFIFQCCFKGLPSFTEFRRFY